MCVGKQNLTNQLSYVADVKDVSLAARFFANPTHESYGQLAQTMQNYIVAYIQILASLSHFLSHQVRQCTC
jgi:hypothetical protein